METLVNIPGRQKAAIMIMVMLAMFLSALDQTVVSTAMPIIVKEFNALEHISWVFTAYMLASTITVPIYGRLSDLYGRKEFFLASIVIFLAGSALCGVAQDMNQLIVFRAIQGIGGGALMTNCFAIIADLFTPVERGTWQGFMGAVFGLSSIIGPFLGGFLTDQVSWRWVFYLNMPLGGVVFFVLLFFMPSIQSSIKNRSIDYVGAFCLTLGLLSLLLALVWGGNLYPWNSPEILLLLAFAFIILSFFVSLEKKVKNPIIPMDLFKNPTFRVSIAATLLIGMGMFSVISYIPLFAQKVIGTSATDSGTILIPLTLGMIFMSIVSGQIISRTGRYKALALVGMLLASAAMYALSRMDSNTTYESLRLRMIFTGLGLGMTMPVFNIVIQNIFERSKIGVVTAAIQLFRSVGGTMGVALMGAILNNQMLKHHGDLGLAIGDAFFFGMLVLLAGFFLTLFLEEVPIHSEAENRSPLTQAGIELAVESGEFSEKNEPRL